MNKVEENNLSMYYVVIDTINNTPQQIMALMPGSVEIADNFKAIVQKIHQKNESLTANRLVPRIIKTFEKETSITLALNLAAAIKAYALSIDDVQLTKDMKFTKSSLYYIRDTESVDKIQFILSKGNELLAQLAPFGVTDNTIVELKDALEKYKEFIPAPRKVTINRKQINDEIKVLFKNAKNTLLRLDALVDILKLSHNEFYKDYFDSRKVINNHGRKLSLRGYIYDTNNNPIQGVLVKINDLKRATKSTEKGYYEFKNLPVGIQNVTFSRVDFKNQTQSVGIVAGQRVQLNVVLQSQENKQDVA